MSNNYSQRWIDTFLRTQDLAQTSREIAFLHRQLRLPRFRRVLDICCGNGRHSAPLSQLGYEITGIDRDPNLIEAAHVTCPSGQFCVTDMRDIEGLGSGRFDAVLCLWQSFGHFDSSTNDAFLRDVSGLLAPAGRFILDIYHRDFFESHQGSRSFERNGRSIMESKRVEHGRLRVELDYHDGTRDCFDWELFTPTTLELRAAARGLSLVSAMSGFDEASPASEETPRMQIVFEKSE